MQTKLTWKVATTAPVLLAVALGVVGCATTEMTSTWTDPTARGASMSRIAVIALSKDPGLRRMAEDTAASQMRGAQAVPSYQVLGDADIRNREVVKAKLLAQGFQGVLVMRMAGVTEQVSAVGGPYGTFDGYYDWAGAAVYARGQQPLLARSEQARLVRRLADLRPLVGQVVHDRRQQGGRQVAGEGSPDPLIEGS